jgi:small multidrug resistance pump
MGKSNLIIERIIILEVINILAVLHNYRRRMITMSWFFLLLGVGAEALSHVALKATDGFSKPLPATLVLLGHLAAFVCLAQAMKGGMPVGIVHALWAGLAIVSVTLISQLVYRQHMDTSLWIGMALIAAGVMVINFSHGHAH